jgi:hypothetical protein
MKKNHAFHPDAGEGLELRLAPSGAVAGAAEIARVDTHGGHEDHSHNRGHEDHSHNRGDVHYKK